MERLKLMKALLGSCKCVTKSPEAKAHDELCYYRLLKEKEAPLSSPSSDRVSLRDCDCGGWKEYLPILNCHGAMSSIRGATHVPYPEKGEFIYCPWCGKKRKAS